jgi:hypothetical protein
VGSVLVCDVGVDAAVLPLPTTSTLHLLLAPIVIHCTSCRRCHHLIKAVPLMCSHLLVCHCMPWLRCPQAARPASYLEMRPHLPVVFIAACPPKLGWALPACIPMQAALYVCTQLIGGCHAISGCLTLPPPPSNTPGATARCCMHALPALSQLQECWGGGA